MRRQLDWQNAKNILCIRLDSMGDVLMTSPAIRALKESVPGRRITLLTSRSGASIAALIPEIDEIITFEAPWMKAAPQRATSSEELALVERLSRSNFDAAVIFTVFSQNPMPAVFLTYLAEIPLTLAYVRENPYHLLTNWVPETDDATQAEDLRHEVRRQLDLVSTVGSSTRDEHLSLEVNPYAWNRIQKVLADIGIDYNRPWAVIHPGASAPSRRYPSDHYAAVAEELIKYHDFQIVFTGAKSEMELVSGIRSMMHVRSFSLAGKLNLREFCALIALAPLMITNNTGPAHIAAALGTPVVDIYALTNPQHTPWMVSNRVLFHDVPCKFCYKSVCPLGHTNCIRLVSPDAVVQASLDLLHQVNVLEQTEQWQQVG